MTEIELLNKKINELELKVNELERLEIVRKKQKKIKTIINIVLIFVTLISFSHFKLLRLKNNCILYTEL